MAFRRFLKGVRAKLYGIIGFMSQVLFSPSGRGLKKKGRIWL
jgi:hypothetical protein